MMNRIHPVPFNGNPPPLDDIGEMPDFIKYSLEFESLTPSSIFSSLSPAMREQMFNDIGPPPGLEKDHSKCTLPLGIEDDLLLLIDNIPYPPGLEENYLKNIPYPPGLEENYLKNIPSPPNYPPLIMPLTPMPTEPPAIVEVIFKDPPPKYPPPPRKPPPPIPI